MSDNTSESFSKDNPLCPDQDEIDRVGLAVPALIKAEIVCGVFLTLYTFIGIAWHYRRQKSSIYLRGRDLHISFIATVGMLFAIWILFARDIVGRDLFPCILIDLVIPAILFFGAVPLLMRAVIQVNKVKFRLLLAGQTFAEHIHDPKFPSSIHLVLAEPESERAGDKPGFLTKGLNRIIHSASTSRLSFNSGKKSNQLGSINTPTLDSRSQTSDNSSRKRAILPDYIARTRFYSGSKFGIIMSLLPGTVVILIFTVVYGVNDGFACVGCESMFRSTSKRYVIFGLTFILFLFALYALWKLKNEPDPKGMRKELFRALFYSRPFGISWLLLSILDPDDLEKDGKVQWAFFICFSFVSIFTVAIYLNIKKSYQFSISKLAANGNDETSSRFDTVLKSEIGVKLFKSHLVNELSIENYYFWKEATDWSASFDKVSKRRRENRFMYLYDMFLDENSSPLLVNLEGNMYAEIRNIAEKKEELTAKSLDGPIHTLYILLSFDSFPRFRETPLYEQYLSETGTATNELDMSL